MKTLGLVLALVCTMGVAASATVVDFYVEPGWSTISCPIVPFNTEPSAVFALQFEAGAILRNGSNADYDYWSQPDANFGNILLGDGYFAYNDYGYAAPCSVDGVLDGVPDGAGVKTDMWISLPRAGWNLIGWPYNTPATIDQDTGAPLMFTDGIDMVSWADAVNVKGWLSGDSMQYYQGSWNFTGFNYGYEDQLVPGKGYYINTTVPNLAMVITAPL
ncbi:MAG: hypothetical protein ACYC64_07325 [Armatimonadota bacterium]